MAEARRQSAEGRGFTGDFQKRQYGEHFFFGALSFVSSTSHSADLPNTDGYSSTPTVAPSGWQFRFTPYAWAPSANGDVTVRGHSAGIDFSFWDIFDSGSSGAELESLSAVMGYVEARKGAWGI